MKFLKLWIGISFIWDIPEFSNLYTDEIIQEKEFLLPQDFRDGTYLTVLHLHVQFIKSNRLKIQLCPNIFNITTT